MNDKNFVDFVLLVVTILLSFQLSQLSSNCHSIVAYTNLYNTSQLMLLTFSSLHVDFLYHKLHKTFDNINPFCSTLLYMLYTSQSHSLVAVRLRTLYGTHESSLYNKVRHTAQKTAHNNVLLFLIL